MTDVLPNGEEPEEEELDPEALAAELDLGIDLSPEEQEAADQMVAHLQAQFASEDAEPAEVEDETPEEVEEEPEPEPPPTEAPPAVATSAPPSTRGVVVIDGIEVPVEEAIAYLTKREAQREAAAQAPPAPAPPQIPEWVDQDDPQDMARWQYMARLEAQQSQLLANQQATAQRQVQSQAMQDIQAGVTTFRTLHPELTENDIATVRLHAQALEIVDGLAKHMDGPDAVAKALDIAYKDHPEFQARATGVPTPAEVKKAERAEKKQKLNALGGSSGSVPRTETRPKIESDADMRAAAKAWLVEQNILPN